MDSKVIVKILSIQEKTSDIIEICLSLAEKQQSFLFTLERDETDPQFISIAEETKFSQLFMFNVHLASQILQLIILFIQGEIVDFPVDIGYFYSKDEALAQQKSFDRELIPK
jgi:elongation factor P hydroxylase